MKYLKKTVIGADFQNIVEIDLVKINLINYIYKVYKYYHTYSFSGGRDKSNNQIRNKNSRKVSDLSDNTISDFDKRDGGPMRYLRHQRSRNRLQDEELKTNSHKSLDGKNVSFSFAHL